MSSLSDERRLSVNPVNPVNLMRTVFDADDREKTAHLSTTPDDRSENNKKSYFHCTVIIITSVKNTNTGFTGSRLSSDNDDITWKRAT